MKTLAQKLARLQRAMAKAEPEPSLYYDVKSLYYDVEAKGFETFMGLPAKKKKPAPAPKREVQYDILDF